MHLNIDIVYEEPQSKIFFKMPKVLFTDEYKDLSAEAKLLYGLMLDRMQLSAINGWCDKNGEVFIFYTIAETSEKLGCGHDKATCKAICFTYTENKHQGTVNIASNKTE